MEPASDTILSPRGGMQPQISPKISPRRTTPRQQSRRLGSKQSCNSVNSMAFVPFEFQSAIAGFESRLSERNVGRLISSAALDEDIEELTPYVTLSEQARKTVTPCRVCVVLFFIIVSFIGTYMVPLFKFRYIANTGDMTSYNSCLRYCIEARDGKAQNDLWPQGALALCEELDGSSTVVYQQCFGHSPRRCVIYDPDNPLPVPEHEILRSKCQFPLVPVAWMPYATVSIFAVAITLVIQGFAPEILLIGAASLLSVLRIITPQEVIAGFANGGVISLAVLFPISEAIGETGVLETVVSLMLGEPTTLSSALIRMIFPVAFVSAFLSNTATVAMMMPVVFSWARRLDVHPGKMLMPLSFAAQLGGCLTLLGGSQCLVAKAAVPSSVYTMGFFDLLPIGLGNLCATAFIIIALASTDLLSSSAPLGYEEDDDGEKCGARPDTYRVIVIVRDRSPHFGGLRGKTLAECGLNRLDGVITVRRYHGSRYVSEWGNADLVDVHEKLEAECDERGVISLRQHPGLALANEHDLMKLGACRRNRHLYEASIRANSELLDETLNIRLNPELLREALGACLIAIKAPREAANNIKLQVGTVLLLEADERWIRKRALKWAETFAVVNQIPNSSPPRGNLPSDVWRNSITVSGLVILISFVTMDYVSLHIGGVLYILVLLFIRALTPAQVLESMKPRILLTIVGALGLGSALQKAGVVTYMAGIIHIAQTKAALYTVIYCISVFLSMFINNSATIAILAPMLVSIAEGDPELNIQPLVWTLVYGAGSCFTTPLGYQTNLMVMPDGKYAFVDFIKFGGVIQICHLAFTVTIICFMAPWVMTII